MTYPPPSGGWNDPAWSGQQSSPPADPARPVSGNPVPTQPTGSDPYAPADPYAADPYAGGDPYAGMKHASGQPGPAAYPPAYPNYGYAPAMRTNGLAIAALVLALVGIGSCVTAPIGAILGHVAQKQIRESGEGGEGMAKAGIIVGWIVTGLYLLVVLFYVAIIVFAISQADTSSTGY